MNAWTPLILAKIAAREQVRFNRLDAWCRRELEMPFDQVEYIDLLRETELNPSANAVWYQYNLLAADPDDMADASDAVRASFCEWAQSMGELGETGWAFDPEHFGAVAFSNKRLAMMFELAHGNP